MMTLTSDQIEMICLDSLLNRPQRVKGKEAEKFIAEFEAEVKEYKKKGWEIELPFEVPDLSEVEDNEDGLKKKMTAAPALDLNRAKSALRTQHMGPGPHPSGTSQDIHAGGGSGSKPAIDDPFDEKSSVALDKFHKEWWSASLANLDPDEREALFDYVDGGYHGINTYLRSGRNDEILSEIGLANSKDEVELYIQNINGFLNENTTPENIMLFRGSKVTMSPGKGTFESKSQMIKNFDDYIEGKIDYLEFSDPGFFSCSANKYVAQNFKGRSNQLKQHSLFFEIKVPKGTPAAPIRFESWEHETEVIFPANTKFKITNMRKEEFTLPKWVRQEDQPTGMYNYYISMEVINE